MIALRRADARGHFDFGWLDTRHTFSFGEYYDPNQMLTRRENRFGGRGARS